MDFATTTWIVCYFLVLLGLSSYGIHRFVLIYLYWKNARNEPKPLAHYSIDELPAVTIQLPIFNEQYVVQRLIEAVSKLDYPKSKLQVQILDDSTDETKDISSAEADKLAELGFDVEFIHRVDRTGFKAGALENGMKTAKGELIYILDADFVPPEGILHDMVHYFTDQKVAVVQTRWGHMNKGYSMLTRVQALFLDGHLGVEQTARSRSGRFFNFNGTAGVWRKAAIVDAGGWEHDTLTEDLDLSYRAQMKGWNFIYLKDVVTPAELPPDMNGFKSQQHRWAKGSAQTCLKMLGPIWRADVPLLIKLEATAHLTANFAYLLLIFLCILVNPSMHPESGWVRMLLLDIPIFFATSVSVAIFYATAQIAVNPVPWKWVKELLYLPVLLALGIGMSINNGKAVLEALFKQESDFVRTPKYGEVKKQSEVRNAKYRALKSVAPAIEIGMFLYFTYLIVDLVRVGNWFSVPFILMFQVGFFLVSVGSMRQIFMSIFSSRNKAEPALGA